MRPKLLNLACPDVWEVTGRLLSRVMKPDWTVLAGPVRLCADICMRRLYAATSAKSTSTARVCAVACRRCEETSHRLKLTA